MKLIDPDIQVKSITIQIDGKNDLRFHNEESNLQKLGFIIHIDNTTQHLRLFENYSETEEATIDMNFRIYSDEKLFIK